MHFLEESPLARGRPEGVGDWKHSPGPGICEANLGIFMRSMKMAMALPADLGTRVDRYRCCLPAL
ncbi:MAG: hypothetical protein ACMG5Z_03915, partial [Luteimonas sp.]